MSLIDSIKTKAKSKYSNYVQQKAEEKKVLDQARADLREKQAIAKAETEARKLQDKANRIRNAPEIAKAKRERARKFVSGLKDKAIAKAKAEMNKPRPKTQSKPMKNPMSEFSGGMNFGNPLAEFAPKSSNRRKSNNMMMSGGFGFNPNNSPLNEFKPKKRKGNKGNQPFLRTVS